MIELQGQIERVTFTNAENGYTVARVRIPGDADPVTVVGTIVDPAPGSILTMRGEWTKHPQFGRQFKIVEYEASAPVTIEGIERYLGSGAIKGIGPGTAKRIVERFGEETLKVIDETPERLSEVGGIGRSRIATVREAWRGQRGVREVMLFLQGNGVSPAYAAKIFKRYGRDALAAVRDDPYRLADEVEGIGFVTADRIAARLGFPRDSLARAEAGTLHALARFASEGHVCCPREALVASAAKLLDAEGGLVDRAIAALAGTGKVVIDRTVLSGGGEAVYLARLHAAERGIAERLKTMVLGGPRELPRSVEEEVRWAETQLPFRLAARQAEAIGAAIRSRVLVITGGPGTGKSTIIKAVARILSREGRTVLLAAPTGRAAKRMSEATGMEAKTIHRLLSVDPRNGSFRNNAGNRLPCDVVIVDESSMIDTPLMHSLLEAIPEAASLVLVGDADQLPSVGPGNVLKDLIDSQAVTVVTLDEIFRQAATSRIVVGAHDIIHGRIPDFSSSEDGDFFFVEQGDVERIPALVVAIVKERIPARFGWNPVAAVQVLAPMNRGSAGTLALNSALQSALNPSGAELLRGERRFRVGDRVMQVRNNYEREVFNGDIGRLSRIDSEAQTLVADFDGRPVTYRFSDLDELQLAYAISVHKSQGSEFPAVVIPLVTQHFLLLQRNLLYTAVTRGKRLVVLVGDKRALAIAVRNDKTVSRHTGLRARLAREPGIPRGG